MPARYRLRKGFTFSITCCPKFPPSPPPPTEYDDHIDDVDELRSDVTIPVIPLICILGGALLFLLLVFYLYFAVRRSRQSQALGREDEEENGDRGFLGDHVDHHVWHIATVGLRRSAINSITAFRFRKEERLIDGTECSVCLTEFREYETLRLLPKCSHAFHIDCIDTWLFSHKNCPLCRAPVLANDTVPESPHEREMNDPDSPGSSSEPRREEQSRNTSETGDGTEIKDRLPGSGSRNPNFLTRAQSDLGNHSTPASLGTVGRSFSMQGVYEGTRGPFHSGAKLLSWTGSRSEDPVLPSRRPGSGPV